MLPKPKPNIKDMKTEGTAYPGKVNGPLMKYYRLGSHQLEDRFCEEECDQPKKKTDSTAEQNGLFGYFSSIRQLIRSHMLCNQSSRSNSNCHKDGKVYLEDGLRNPHRWNKNQP
jgi:hypothetical protein